MANIKSAKKRVLIAEANRQRNVAFKTSIKTAVKKVLALAVESDKEALNAAISKVYQLCDKAVSKGILHKNTAARKKSRLTLAVKKLAKSKIDTLRENLNNTVIKANADIGKARMNVMAKIGA